MNPSSPTDPALNALRSWFGSGHSRFAMRLRGSLDGQVLVAHDQGPEQLPSLIARSVISNSDGIVTDRRERPISLDEIALDPVNGPALIEACSARLLGRIDPPHICPTSRSDKLRQ